MYYFKLLGKGTLPIYKTLFRTFKNEYSLIVHIFHFSVWLPSLERHTYLWPNVFWLCNDECCRLSLERQWASVWSMWAPSIIHLWAGVSPAPKQKSNFLKGSMWGNYLWCVTWYRKILVIYWVQELQLHICSIQITFISFSQYLFNVNIHRGKSAVV